MKECNQKKLKLSKKDHISAFACYAGLNNYECSVLIALNGSYIEDLDEDTLYNNYVNSIYWLKNLSFDPFSMDLKEFAINASIANLAGYNGFKDLILANENDIRNFKIEEIIKKACKAKENYKFID